MKKFTEILIFIFLSTTYLAQSQDTIHLKEVVISDRESIIGVLKKVKPVSILSIDNIQFLSSSKGLPELASRATGVSFTQGGGGVGDGQIRMRGFDVSNILVLINGIPESSPDDGWVYWSNYIGLEDFTSEIRIERGIANSHFLSLPGGTFSINTITGEEKKEITAGYSTSLLNGNKFLFRLSSGRLQNNWSYAAGFSRNSGHTFVDGSKIDGYSYYLGASKIFKNKDKLEFRFFGNPQTHWQNGNMQQDSTYRNYGETYNSSWGYQNGSEKTAATNFYFRTAAYLKYTHYMKDKSIIEANAVFDYGNGGGMRSFGNSLPNNKDGQIDFDEAIFQNINIIDTINQSNGSKVIGRNAKYFLGNFRHSGFQTGLIASWRKDFSKAYTFRAGTYGIFGRYKDYGEVEDLLGADFSVNYSDVNNPVSIIKKGDKLWYNESNIKRSAGLFIENTYSDNNWNAFVSGNLFVYSNTIYNYFGFKVADGQKIDAKPFVGYNAKGGVSYNIFSAYNIFINGGYYKRKPKAQIIGNTVIDNIPPEQNLAIEGGVNYKNKSFIASLNVYISKWIDRTNTYWGTEPGTSKQYVVGVKGIQATQKGIELETEINPVKKLKISMNAYYAWWNYTKNVNAQIKDPQQNIADTVNLYLDGMVMSGQPQTSLMFSLWYFPLKSTTVLLDFKFSDRNYANNNIFNSTSIADQGVQPYQLPSWALFDLSIQQNLSLCKNIKLKLAGTIHNIFDSNYINEASDGELHDKSTSYFYYGAGRTLTVSAYLNFF